VDTPGSDATTTGISASESLVQKRDERTGLATNLSSVRKQINNIVSNHTQLMVKLEDVSELKARIEGLNEQAGELGTRLGVLDRDIDRLEQQQIDKKDLRRVLKEFGEIYTQASPEAKRRSLNVIIEEIRCSVKRGERKGEILYRLRGDCSVTKEWEHARKQENPKPPSSGGSSFQVSWLRETSQCANSVSAPEASGYRPEGPARRDETCRKPRKTWRIPRFGPGRHQATGSPPIRAAAGKGEVNEEEDRLCRAQGSV